MQFNFGRSAVQTSSLRLNKLANKNDKAPLLPPGVLDDVVKNTIGFLKNSKKIEKYGVKIKRGIILDGPPGNGKTMICRYIQKLCSQNSIRWGVVTSADIDKAYHDRNLSDLFQSYTVTFFDDIDVAYMDRTRGNGKMACSLLTAMDGITESEHLVRIFTTNESVESLDPVFTRPGRIDRCITISKPSAELRRRLVLEVWPKEISENIDVDFTVEQSNDFSFAELEAIRTFLVTNKVLGDGTWDVDRAFEEFDERKKEDAKSIGLMGANSGGKKRKKSNRPKRRILPNSSDFEEDDLPEDAFDRNKEAPTTFSD